MKEQHRKAGNIPAFRRLNLKFVFVAIFVFFYTMGNIAAQTVEIGIIENPERTLNVYLRPTADITAGTFNSLQFTIKWPDNTVNPIWAVQNFSVTTSGPVDFNNGFRYQEFTASPASTINWTAGQEYLVLQINYSTTGLGCGGQFEIGTDAYTQNILSGLFNIQINSTNLTGSVYSQAAGDLKPIFVQNKTITNVACNSGATGIIDIAAIGDFPPLKFSTDGINYQNTGYFTGIAAGSYNVRIRDNNFCIKTVAVVITQPEALGLTETHTNVSTCAGYTNGQIVASGTGGVEPYQFSIGGAYQGSGTFNNVAAGSYSLTLIDANSCTKAITALVTEPNPVVISSTSNNIYPCYGNTTGSISAIASGDSPPFLYSIDGNNFLSNGTFTNLPAGNYTITVKNANLCQTTKAITLTQPLELGVLSSSVTDVVTCYNDPYGYISIVGSGGTTPLSYSIDGTNYQNTGNFSSLTGGNYTVIIKDFNNCTKSSNFTINQPSELVISNIDKTDLLCANALSGSITVTAVGGSTPLVYSIDNTNYQLSNNFTGLDGGTYPVKVKDSHNCFKTETVEVFEPSQIVLNVNNFTNVTLCAGNNDGTITVVASGGTGILLYSLNNGAYQTTGQFTGLAAGDYEVIVKDENNCTKIVNFSLSQPNPIITVLQQKTDVSCFGGTNGTITVFASGGTGNLQYALGNGTYQATGTFVDLSAGNYIVNVKDDNGCILPVQMTILQPDQLIINLQSQNNVACNGTNTGSAVVLATGGTGVKLYSKDNGTTFQSNGNFPNLYEGTYTFLARDEKYCTATTTVYISQPEEITVVDQIITSSSVCNTPDGSITIIATGGTAPLTYQLNSGAFQTNGIFENLVAGNYTVTVRDANNCSLVIQIVLNQQNPIVLDEFEFTNVTCAGQNNGTITAVATGGAGTLEYSINGVVFQATGIFTGLAPNNYMVTIRDDNNCNLQDFAYITEPNPITMNLIAQNNISGCFGDATGQLEVAASGGIIPLVYSIDGNNFTSTPAFTGLTAGNYTVTVRDANLCTKTLETTISQPAQLIADLEAIDISCFGVNDGASNMVITGGSPPYTFAWSNDSTGQNISNLAAGSYSVTITDSHDCSTENSMQIIEPSEIQISLSKTDVMCNGAADGTIASTISGGTTPYIYRWIPNGSTMPAIQHLAPGSYTLKITDSRNCINTETVQITEPERLIGNVVKEDVTYFGEDDGSADLSVYGGIEPYTFIWSNGAETEDIYDLASGDYGVIITDQNSCELVLNVKILTIHTEFNDIPNAFSPNGDGINDTWYIKGISSYPSAVLRIFDISGKLIYEDIDGVAPWDGRDLDGNELPSKSIYYYIIDIGPRNAPRTGAITLIR